MSNIKGATRPRMNIRSRMKEVNILPCNSMHGLDISNSKINPMRNIKRLEKRQDRVKMFRIRHTEDLFVLEAVHPKIWGAKIIPQPHTFNSSVIMSSIDHKRVCPR